PAAPPAPPTHALHDALPICEGQIELRSVEPVELEKPVATARRMGRFAVELLIGQELIDRVRFDFPLLAGEEALGKRRPHDAPPSDRKSTRLNSSHVKTSYAV